MIKNDAFLKVVKGYKQIEDYMNSTSYLFDGISRCQNVFGFKDDNFSIEYDEDLKVKNAMNEYFIDRKLTNRDLYPNYNLRMFLNHIGYSLVTIGDLFYEINWENEKIHGLNYILPINFSYLPPETMHFKRNRDKFTKFIQKYSWLTYLFNRYKHVDLVRKTEYVPEKIFYLRYFDEKTPMQKSLQYLKKSDEYSNFLMNASIANTYPENKDLTISLARMKSIKEEKLKYDLNQALIAKQFSSFIKGTKIGASDSGSFKITEYYDIFLVMRSLNYRDKLRTMILSFFNDQILQRVAEKNEFNSVPKLRYNSQVSYEDLNTQFEKYKVGEVSYNDMLIFLKKYNADV